MIVDVHAHCTPVAFSELAGSDYPITLFFEPYAKNFDTIREANLPAADVEAILGGNAEKLLALNTPARAESVECGGGSR